MPAQEHLVGQFTDRCQESTDITLPALAHDDAIGSIRANELRTKPNSDLMLGKDEVTSSNLVSSSPKTPEIFRSVLIKKYLESIENTNFIDRRPRKQVEKGHYLKR